MNVKNVDAVKQIFPQRPFGHRRLGVLVGCRQQAYVNRDLLAATQPTNRSFFNNAQQLDCSNGGISAISSSSKVPPSANSKHPARIEAAPVKAPFSCPKSSDSINVSGIAEQLMPMNGCSRPGLS